MGSDGPAWLYDRVSVLPATARRARSGTASRCHCAAIRCQRCLRVALLGLTADGVELVDVGLLDRGDAVAQTGGDGDDARA